MIKYMNKILDALRSIWRMLRKLFRRNEEIIFSNSKNTGVHCGKLTKLAEADVRKACLVSFGKDEMHVKLCGKNSLPIGVSTDVPDSEGDPVNVSLLGVLNETVKINSAEDIKAGAHLILADNGSVKMLPELNGTYLLVGLSLGSAKKGEPVEVSTCVPSIVKISK